jgi:galactokinase
VEVATAYALLGLMGKELPLEEIAVLCRAAENDYVGSPCGIMDQFVIAAAQAGHALLLDTRKLKYEHLPMNQGELAGTQIVVCNSMVKHSVASGEYGVRHKQVMEGQEIITERFPNITCLGDATLEDLLEASKRPDGRPTMSDASFKRCRHIISDNARVRNAKIAMFNGDPKALGELMHAGHASERDDFECSTEEIDFLVETAETLPGCYGARLTGGGFGGCTVNLVDREDVQTFVDALRQAYQKKFEIDADIFVCDAVDGAERLNNKVRA